MTSTLALGHHYAPRGAARDLMACRAPEVLVSGPAGTGKSRACLEKLHLMCLINPGMRALLVRKTATSLTSSALVTWDDIVAKEAMAMKALKYFGGSPRIPPQYRYKNDSVINIGGMDNPTRVMSTEYDVIYVQEATELTIDDWEALTSRLRNGVVSFQQLIADTNPSAPTHWLKERCDNGTCVLLESRHEDNPRLFGPGGEVTPEGESYIGRLDALTGVRYYRLRKGLWVAAEGMIYEEWDPAIHIIKRFTIPEQWTRWWAVDFGYTNPFVLQRWAEDGDGRLYLYAEQYFTRRTVDQHARDVLDLVSKPDSSRPLDLRARVWHEPKPRGILADHDAEGRETLSQAVGLGTQAADKRVIEGIQAVTRRLRPAGDGKPRLFLMADSVTRRDQDLIDSKLPTCTAEEIPAYVWAVKPGGELKEEPLKQGDHGCDAMRYLCLHRELGSPRVRSM